jgi:hypothetical protein
MIAACICCRFMVDGIDQGWWKTFRAELEEAFKQQEIVNRAQTI